MVLVNVSLFIGMKKIRIPKLHFLMMQKQINIFVGTE